ncbi:MAG: ABC transporter substrate-binding protein [Myxococcota bacterium]
MTQFGMLRVGGAFAICLGISSLSPVRAQPVQQAPPPERGQAETPKGTESVEALHAALLEVMRDAETLGYEGRSAQLAPVIPRHFDVEFMARKAVGRHWQKASDEEKQLYLETFGRFMVANYAGRFDGYSGQSFETMGEESARSETLLVRTQLVDPTDENVELSYRLRQVPEGWKIIDVYMDGTVSELALRRSEFSSVAKREGFDALIETLNAKIAKLAASE